MSGAQVAPVSPPVTGGVLEYAAVRRALHYTLDWLAETYVDALNTIHDMHDKYAYERVEMALHDYPARRFLATGIAGLSVAADSLSAIRYATVRPPGARRDRPRGRLHRRGRVTPATATTTTGPTPSPWTSSSRSWIRPAGR
ncbi:MAG: formate C-acetyltransferase [Cryptosporangiaceae bacterium]|jgi:pyruvate-formate lyase|nr:formate C-acetyltransferase [Cryptosporangiaceae bacterium]